MLFNRRTQRIAKSGFDRRGWMLFLPEVRRDDVRSWELGVGSWMLDVGCWMLEAGCWMLEAGCWRLNVGWIVDRGRIGVRRVGLGSNGLSKAARSARTPNLTFSRGTCRG